MSKDTLYSYLGMLRAADLVICPCVGGQTVSMLAGAATVTRRTAAALSTAGAPILSHVSCTAARMSQVLTTHWAETRSLTLKNCVKFSQNVDFLLCISLFLKLTNSKS